jgi:Ser/Thr protein kinase RdoA (MazF antagonist)
VSIDRRNPYQPFDPFLIRSFLGGRDILSVDLLPTGKCNTNYKLSLSDGEVCVLRLYSRESAEREIYAMNLVREIVPVPRAIDRGETWSVFSFLEGKLLAEVPEYSDLAAAALTELLQVRFSSPGFLHADGSVSAFPFGGLRGFIAEKLESAAIAAWLKPEVVEAIGNILKQEARCLDELEAQCYLVHGDFNPTNILIHQGSVNGLLDWEYCHSGTPYMDIGNLLRNTDPRYHARIQSGLKKGGMSLPDDWKKRAELVDLSALLEFLTSPRSDLFKRRCVDRIKQSIAKLSFSQR